MLSSKQANIKVLKTAILILIFCFFSLIFGFVATDGGEGFILIGTSLLSVAILSATILTRKDYFLLEPITYILLIVIFSFFLKSFYVILEVKSNPIVANKLLFGMGIENLSYGALILLLGLIFLSIGYSIKLPRLKIPNKITTITVSKKRFILFSFASICISYISFFLFVDSLNVSLSSLEDLSRKRFQGEGETAASRLDSLSYIYYRLSLLAKAPMYFLIYFKLKNRFKWKSLYGFLLIGCISINLIVPFFISNKAGILLPLTDILVMAYIINRKINFKKIILIGVPILLVLSFIASVRAGDSIAGHSVADRLFGDRYLMGITKNAHIINGVPEKIDFFYGETLIAWSNIFLPESLKFDNKAFTELDYYIGSRIFDNDFSGIPPGIISEMYLNFGAAGVIFGMLLIGIFLRWMHHTLLYPTKENSPLMLILYAIIMVRLPVFLFNNGLGVTILKILADTLIVLIFIFLAMKIKRN